MNQKDFFCLGKIWLNSIGIDGTENDCATIGHVA